MKKNIVTVFIAVGLLRNGSYPVRLDGTDSYLFLKMSQWGYAGNVEKKY